MRVLGIETSCDETAAAVVRDGRWLEASVVSSQIALHAPHGGVVPETAARAHVGNIVPVLEAALRGAGVGWEAIDAVAVTAGPGLAGALVVGANVGKAIAFARGLPLIGVNHLEGHIYANWLAARPGEEPPPEPRFPLLCLIVSGGHTDLVLMHDHGRFERLGRTRDDAAGEAFDKAARILGLGYPGGPAIQRAAAEGRPRFPLPRAWMKGTYDFSFSGLKTALLRLVADLGEPLPVADLAASFQEAVADVLSAKTAQAAAEFGVAQVAIGGGVAANLALRRMMQERSPVPVLLPPLALCTDNGAVIASAGYFHLRRGERSSWALDVDPNLAFA